jgi:hypothetical protein
MATKRRKIVGSGEDTGVAGYQAEADEIDDDSEEEQTESEEIAEFIATARERFHECAEDPSSIKNRKAAVEDDRFYNNDQWPKEIRARLKSRKRPVITVNRVKGGCRIITNSLLQDRPSIKVNPVDDFADLRTAEILNGIIRHIEANSMAEAAYDTVVSDQVKHGFGFLRLRTDFPHPLAMDQEIYIDGIEDSYSVFLGPALKPDGSDRDYAFIVYDLTAGQYKEQFPDSAQAGLNDFTALGNTIAGWGSKNMIRVAEYYFRTHRSATIIKLKDGSVVEKSKLGDDIDDKHLAVLAEQDDEGNYIERETTIPEVHWCKINAVEILEGEHKKRNVPGRYIPIIEVIGDKTILDGITTISGSIRDAKDAQRQYNYFRSKMTEAIALAPQAPVIMADGQDENHEDEWNNANQDLYSVLRYTPKSISGQLAPPPQFNNYDPPIRAMTVAAAQYLEDIKATQQVFDASLGASGNETSGRAIESRKAQSGTANYNYANNFIRSLRYLGIIILNWIPEVYDAKTVTRIIGEDGKPEQVQLRVEQGQPAYEEQQGETPDDGITKIYNVGVGQYDVVVDVGVNYLTKRQESFDMLTKLVNSFPAMMNVAADIIVRNSDIPGAIELSDRLKRLLPPELQEGGDEAMPPAIKEKFEQLMQEREVLAQNLETALDEIRTKRTELEGDFSIAQLKAESDRLIAANKADSTEQIAAINSRTTVLIAEMKTQSEAQAGKLSILESMLTEIIKPNPIGQTTTTPPVIPPPQQPQQAGPQAGPPTGPQAPPQLPQP